MAEKKTTAKKTAPKKVEKSLMEQLTDKRNDLLEAQKSHRSGELVNPRVLKENRKDIARLLTAIRREELTKESK